ncbi:hypothetical protein ACWCPM_19300 [Streptomyces sp. NPDC002309]
MSADEVRGESSAAPQPARRGPRHAAPKKPLFTRFQVPAGRAIAVAAMPTAILMGMGLTPKLALADDRPVPKSLTAEEYEACVELLKQGDEASPSPSASASESESGEPSPSASATGSPQAPETPDDSGDGAADDNGSGNGSSSDSGSDDEAEPAPSPSASTDKDPEPQDATPAPGGSQAGDGGVLDAIGDTITGVVDGITGIGKGEESTSAPTPSPSASSGAEDDTSGDTDGSGDSGEDTAGPGKDIDPPGDGAEEPTDAASDAAEEAEEPADEATASPTPSPSASATVDPDDCPIATDVEGGIDNEILLPDDPWFLEASSLKLKGADYQGIVKVKTASGNVKEVLKYVISDGTDIGDLHQTVKDRQSGKTYHVQADKGSMSTITDGDTVMYTEKISGKLLGLIPLTFSPESPPPLNIPEIFFTDVKVQQAGQFGGTLYVPGLSSYITD